MRKGRDGEWKKWKKNGKWKKKNNGENSGPLTSLQVDRLTATDCNAAARANISVNRLSLYLLCPPRSLVIMLYYVVLYSIW